MAAKGIWYFAYGSNMRSSVMQKRGITPLSTCVVVVPTHYLTFDIFGIPYVEPSFASVAAFTPNTTTILTTGSSKEHIPVQPAHGIAYLLTPADYRQLVISEGGGVAYNEIEVDARVIPTVGDEDKPTTLVARTLQAKFPWTPNGAPSARYLALLSDGCKEFNMPAEYCTYIDSLPSYEQPTSLITRVGGSIFLSFWRPLLRALVLLIKAKTDGNGHCPRWLGWVIMTMYGLMWMCHDNVQSRVWGRGDGTKLFFRAVG